MAARSPTSATVPLRRSDNEAADLWDRLVASGMDAAQATALVQATTGAMPRDVAAVSMPEPSGTPAPVLRAEPEVWPHLAHRIEMRTR